MLEASHRARGINMKKQPIIKTNHGDDNEFIMDPLNRMGRLVNIGEYYMFQPVELTDKHISRYDRVTPIPYKRKQLH